MDRRKVILYIATSLDGYIARENGAVDWLFSDEDYGYKDFMDTIDTIILGNRTYRQALSCGEFPYKGKQCFVFSKTIMGKTEDVIFVNEGFEEFVEKLRETSGRGIWLVGGTRTIDLFMKNKLVDEIILSIHPVILGSGIELFKKYEHEIKLDFKCSTNFQSGLVQIHYNVSNL